MKNLLLTLALLGGAAAAQTSTPAQTPATPPAQTAPAQAAPTQAAPATTEPVLVGRVGNEIVTLAEFDRAFRLAAARVVNSQGAPFEESYLAEFAGARPEYLTQYLRDRAVYQLARVANRADAKVLDEQMAEARADFESDAEFAEALAASGFGSPADLRAELERQAIVGAYLEALKARFSFGDAVVSSYYSLNRARFAQDAEACVKHILVPTQAEAQAIVKELQAGADFAKVAADKSQDPGSAPDGGDLGCFGRGEMVEAFDRASFTGKVGELQTVRSQFGWHVLIVTKRSEAGTLALAEAAPLIREQLARDAAQKYLDTQIARLKTESFPDAVGKPAN